MKRDEAQVGTCNSFKSEEVHPDPDEPQQAEEAVPCTVKLPQPLQARTHCQRLDSHDPKPHHKIRPDGLDEAMTAALDAASSALVAALGLNPSLRNREVFAAEAMSTAIEN